MSGVNEAIVREYFESLGFLVSQPCKYVVPGRHKQAEEELGLLVFNPLAAEHRMPEHLAWSTEDLRGISRAVVAVFGWHTERFSSARFAQTPEILAFTGDAAVRAAGQKLGSGNVAKILCLAGLPASGELTRNTLAMLKERGVDGVILFRTILQHLVMEADKNKNYEKSDLLQIIRILKSHNLFRDGQMDLFEKKRRTRNRKA